MKKAALIFILIVTLVTVGVVFANGPTVATGSGHYHLSGGLRTFAFNAMIHQDGRITGQAQAVRHDLGVHVHATITCIDIDTNTATMSGVVTSSNHATIGPGHPIWFRVVDNGEGLKATAPDQITNFYLSGESCDAQPPFFLVGDIEHGNIQVK